MFTQFLYFIEYKGGSTSLPVFATSDTHAREWSAKYHPDREIKKVESHRN